LHDHKPLSMKKYFVASFILIVSTLSSQNIATYAGTGIETYIGAGPAAISTNLKVNGVLVDSNGDLLICDSNHLIWKVNNSGAISVLAGIGSSGYWGDNVLAASTPIYGPSGMVLDISGNLIFCDFSNSRVRKINTEEIITTIAGTGIHANTGDFGPAINANIYYPDFSAVDTEGNLYFTEGNGNLVRRISTSGIITTIAGTGIAGYNGDGIPATTAKLNFPCGIAIDSHGNIYISEHFGHRIRKINSLGIISTIAGDGIPGFGQENVLATSSRVRQPAGMKLDAQGNLYFADMFNNQIRKINASGIVSTVAGMGYEGFAGDGGTALEARLNKPFDIAFSPEGNMFISDNGNHRVRMVTNVLSNTDFISDSMKVTVAPNPAINKQTTISFPASSEFIQVFNTLGQQVLTKNILGMESLDIGLNDAGIYLIKVSVGNQTAIRKLIVK
jgi:sugar lactone lactonase YvrE